MFFFLQGHKSQHSNTLPLEPQQTWKVLRKICCPLLARGEKSQTKKSGKICDLCTAGGPLQLKHQKSADMKYLANNFQDNCRQGCWIFQIARTDLFRLSGSNFSVQNDRHPSSNQTPLIKSICYILQQVTKRNFNFPIVEHLK